MSRDTAAVPRGETTNVAPLTIRGGCHGGPYEAWMEALGVESPDAVRELVDEAGIEPVVDTAGRAEDCKYDRPEEEEAYLTLRQQDAEMLLNQTN